MGTTVVLIIIALLLVLAAVAAFLVSRRKKERETLKDRFGPEYDRAVDEHGSRREAEHRLSDAASRRDKAQVRDLTPAERDAFAARWTSAQGDFVDDPVAATRDADVLVGQVMRERGYPLDDVGDTADLVAAEHVELAAHYRSAHEIGQRAEDATTEELRQAFVHYRALFVELLAEPHGRHQAADDEPGDGATDGTTAGRDVDLTAREREDTSRGTTTPPA